MPGVDGEEFAGRRLQHDGRAVIIVAAVGAANVDQVGLDLRIDIDFGKRLEAGTRLADIGLVAILLRERLFVAGMRAVDPSTEWIGRERGHLRWDEHRQPDGDALYRARPRSSAVLLVADDHAGQAGADRRGRGLP